MVAFALVNEENNQFLAQVSATCSYEASIPPTFESKGEQPNVADDEPLLVPDSDPIITLEARQAKEWSLPNIIEGNVGFD